MPDYDLWLYRGDGGPHDDRPDPPEEPDPGPVTPCGMCRACGCARLPEEGGRCPDCGGPVPPPPDPTPDPSRWDANWPPFQF